jgi:hypothetical protein
MGGHFLHWTSAHQLDAVPFAHSSPHPHSLTLSPPPLPFPSLRSRLLSQAGRLAAILHRGYVNAFVDCLRAGWRLVWLARCQAKPSQATHRIGAPESDPSLSSGGPVTGDRVPTFLPRKVKQALLSVDPPSLLLQSILVSCLPTYLPTSWSTLVKTFFHASSLPPFLPSTIPLFLQRKVYQLPLPPRHKGTPTRSFDDTTTTS